MTQNYVRSLPGDVLMEVEETTDGSERYFSDWADVTDFGTIRVYASAPGFDSDSGEVLVAQGFSFSEPGTPETLIMQSVPAVTNPDTISGGYFALAELPVYARAAQVWVRGVTASQPVTVSVRGVK